MVKNIFILLVLCVGLFIKSHATDSLRISGQISGWAGYTHKIIQPVWAGGRYIPQLNYSVTGKNQNLFSTELSINTYGFFNSNTDSVTANGKIKPFRVWARYSANQFEIRAGLQKINFGQATIMRPLMWFDQMDPRDPLQLTDGVYGLLFRYYFLNNANIWAWCLFGNNKTKGWEYFETKKWKPEFGGRIQLPLPKGEAALSCHYRQVQINNFALPQNSYNQVPELRLGFDIRFDIVAGFYLEASYTKMPNYTNQFANNHVISAGTDYTFNIGNGLSVIYEQVVFSLSQNVFNFNNSATLSLLNCSYQVSLFDNVGLMFYYDYKNSQLYSFANWQKQLNKISLHAMVFANPGSTNLPLQNQNLNLFAGNGIQLMIVYNY